LNVFNSVKEDKYEFVGLFDYVDECSDLPYIALSTVKDSRPQTQSIVGWNYQSNFLKKGSVGDISSVFKAQTLATGLTQIYFFNTTHSSKVGNARHTSRAYI
jgi:hypothetical protein